MLNLFLKSIKYSLVGLVNTTISFLVILILEQLSPLNSYVINIIAYGIGVINSFFLNRNWTFKTSQKAKKETGEFLRFIIIFIITYLLQFCCLWVLIEILIFPTLLSQAIAMALYVIVGFLLNNYFTFREK